MLSCKRRPRKAWCGEPRRGAGCERLSLAARADVDVGGGRDVELQQQSTGTKVQSALREAGLAVRSRLR